MYGVGDAVVGAQGELDGWAEGGAGRGAARTPHPAAQPSPALFANMTCSYVRYQGGFAKAGGSLGSAQARNFRGYTI